MACVLVVDDNADLRRVAALVLRRLGKLEVLTAGSGVEALGLLETERVDLVLLDLTMPDMDGLSVLEALQRSDGAPRVPVVMYTASTGNGERERAMALGAKDFLSKDIDAGSMTSRVTACLREESEQQENA